MAENEDLDYNMESDESSFIADAKNSDMDDDPSVGKIANFVQGKKMNKGGYKLIETTEVCMVLMYNLQTQRDPVYLLK